MCAYNRIDGQPACANSNLLQKELRGDWGFQGYVVSDCGAIRDIYAGHKFKPNAAEASATAVKTGTDLTCGNEYRSLVDAVKQGLITEAEINRSLERLFVARFRLGMFDPPARVPFSSIPYSENDSEAHRAIAREAARKSIVLLKNENAILPLANSVRSIAVIGPSAADPVAMLGNYNGFSSKHVSPLEGIENQFAAHAKVNYALGATYTSQTAALIPTAALTPPHGAGHGLLAEYFDNPDFTGTPKISRTESYVWLGEGMAKPQYSIRWSGSLLAPVTGKYRLSATGGSGRNPVRIFLQDKEVSPSSPVFLEAGRSYPLRVEYRAQPNVPGAQLNWIPPADPLLAQAIETINKSDVTVAFVGLNPNLEGEEMRVSIPGFAGGDRTDLKLPETQEKLLAAAFAAGKPVIVVLTSGSALAANDAAAKASAILQLWYAGEESGTAIAETLAGLNNPAGRLPVTFYKSADQLPPFDDYNMDGRTYRYFKGEPLYPFGFGLSYSQFRYSGLKTRRTAKAVSVSCTVRNTSNREGDEVAQLYLDGPNLPSGAIRELKAFARLHLKPGESRELTFPLDPASLPQAKLTFTIGGGQPGPNTPVVRGTL
jgi:beta-glucosidase